MPSRPDLIEFHKLTRSNATHNLQQAFNIAEQHLGLTKLLDPEGERHANHTPCCNIQNSAKPDVLIRLEPLLRLTQTLKSYGRVTVVLIYTRNNQILVC